jgi:hypothetical protein
LEWAQKHEAAHIEWRKKEFPEEFEEDEEEAEEVAVEEEEE